MSAIQKRHRRQNNKYSSLSKLVESQNQTTESQTNPQIIYQPISDPRGYLKLKLMESSGDALELPQWAESFKVIVHQKQLSNTEKMQ